MTLLAAAIAWLAAATAVALGVQPLVAAPAAIAAALLLPARGSVRRLTHVVGALLVVLVAAAHLSPARTPLPSDSIGRHLGETTRLLARADADGDAYPASVAVSVQVLARDLDGDWQPAGGHLGLVLPATATVREGDEIELFGRLDPPGGYTAPPGYADWLERRGVVASMAFPRLRPISAAGGGGLQDTLKRFRARLEQGLQAALPANEAAFASTLLFGNRHTLSPEFRRELSRTGLSHLVVVSAFNLMLLYGTVLALLAPFAGRRRAALIALALAVAYGSLSGQTPSVLRGELLTALLCLATLSGRPYSRPALLVLAAAAVTLGAPGVLADAGFQLTFGAAAGIALIAPVVRPALIRLRFGSAEAEPSPVVESLLSALAVSLAATLATLPVAIAAFGAVNPYGPLANSLLNPFIPLLTGLTLMAGLLGSLATAAAFPVAAPLLVLLTAAQHLIHLFAGLPGAAIPVQATGIPIALLWYGAIAASPEAVRLLRRLAPGRFSPRGTSSGATRRRWYATRRPLAPTLLLILLIGAVPAAAKAARSAATAPRGPAMRWLDLAGRSALVVQGRNGATVLLTDESAPAVVARALEVDGSSGAPDAVVLLGSVSDEAPSVVAKAIATAVHAGTALAPTARSGPPGETGSQSGMAGGQRSAVAVAGKAVLDLGGNDVLDLFNDGEGGLVARIVIGSRSVIVAGNPAMADILDRWQSPGRADVVALLSRPGARTRDALAALRPAVVLLPGHAPDDLELAAASVAGGRVLPLAGISGLHLALKGSRLELSYQDAPRH